MGHEIRLGKLPPLRSGGGYPPTELDVGDVPAGRAVEMTVLVEIRAEAGRFPVDMNSFDQATSNHGLEAVVDRGERDRGHPLLGPDEDLRGRGMIPLLHQHLVDMPPLGSES